MQHLHHLLVLVFTLSISYKAILLLSNKTEALERYRKKTLLPEILVSVAVLATGFYMFFTNEGIMQLTEYHVKATLVIACIPLGIIGFKKKSKPLAALVMLTLVAIYAYMIYVHYMM